VVKIRATKYYSWQNFCFGQTMFIICIHYTQWLLKRDNILMEREGKNSDMWHYHNFQFHNWIFFQIPKNSFSYCCNKKYLNYVDKVLGWSVYTREVTQLHNLLAIPWIGSRTTFEKHAPAHEFINLEVKKLGMIRLLNSYLQSWNPMVLYFSLCKNLF